MNRKALEKIHSSKRTCQGWGMSKSPSQHNNLGLAFIYRSLESNCLITENMLLYVQSSACTACNMTDHPASSKAWWKQENFGGWMYHSMKHCQLSATVSWLGSWLWCGCSCSLGPTETSQNIFSGKYLIPEDNFLTSLTLNLVILFSSSTSRARLL